MRWQSYEVRWWLPDSRHDLRWTFQIFVTLRPCQDSQTCHRPGGWYQYLFSSAKCPSIHQNTNIFTCGTSHRPPSQRTLDHPPRFRRESPAPTKGGKLLLPVQFEVQVTFLSNAVVLCWKWKVCWVDHTYFFSQLNCTAKMFNWDEEVLRRKKRILRRNRSLPVVL